MNITVKTSNEWEPHLWVGGYSNENLTIIVDKTLPLNHQQGVVIHEIIETYCPFLTHRKVDDLTGHIQSGLLKLMEVGK